MYEMPYQYSFVVEMVGGLALATLRKLWIVLSSGEVDSFPRKTLDNGEPSQLTEASGAERREWRGFR
jgi:hypothetical protein